MRGSIALALYPEKFGGIQLFSPAHPFGTSTPQSFCVVGGVDSAFLSGSLYSKPADSPETRQFNHWAPIFNTWTIIQ